MFYNISAHSNNLLRGDLCAGKLRLIVVVVFIWTYCIIVMTIYVMERRQTAWV